MAGDDLQPAAAQTCGAVRPIHLMIIPGNGCDRIERANWYCWLADKLKAHPRVEKVVCTTLPDAQHAREQYWAPFVVEKMQLKKVDAGAAPLSTAAESTTTSGEPLRILIGHSSGAVCIMRLLEEYQVDGVFLISGCINDLGEESERMSCYYPQQPPDSPWSQKHGFGTERPWRWDLMRKGAGFLVHIGSSDDPFIPVEQMRHIRRELKLEKGNTYFEFADKGHFMQPKSMKILEIVQDKLGLLPERGESCFGTTSGLGLDGVSCLFGRGR